MHLFVVLHHCELFKFKILHKLFSLVVYRIPFFRIGSLFVRCSLDAALLHACDMMCYTRWPLLLLRYKCQFKSVWILYCPINGNDWKLWDVPDNRLHNKANEMISSCFPSHCVCWHFAWDPHSNTQKKEIHVFNTKTENMTNEQNDLNVIY